MPLFNKEQIKKIVPYDEPFLFVDEVEKIEDNKISGSYQTSKDDYYFRGHFVDFKIMPGVLVIEALAQLSTILLRQKIGKNHKEYHFLAYDVKGVQFLKPIFPGDKIKLNAEVLGVYPIKKAEASKRESENKISHIKAQAQVREDLKCEARFSVVIVDKKEFKAKYLC